MKYLTRILKSQTTKYLLAIFILSLVVMWPSFSLALTGDDYLGYWRLTKTIGSRPDNISLLKYFFTDYGPQDVITYIIHSFVGFNSRYYFVVAFILRFIASLSFFPLAKKLFKNNLSAFITSSFFMITSTGMEVIDWSFNMPSYVGIAFMNLSLLFLLNAANNKDMKHLWYSLLFFTLAIISQPIRLIVILPIILSALIYISTFIKTDKLRLIYVSVFYIFSFYTLFSISGYTSGANVVSGEANNGGITKISTGIIANIESKFKASGFQVVLSPIAQIGNIVFPTTEIYKLSKIKNYTLDIIVLALTFCSLLTSFYLTKWFSINKINVVYPFATIIIWFLVLKLYLVPMTGIIFGPQILVGYAIGGFFLVLSLFMFFITKNYNVKLPLLISLLIITFSFLPPWLRDPGYIELTKGRYLIVSAAGLSIFMGTIHKIFSNNIVTMLFISLIFLLNIHTTSRFILHLKDSRNFILADNLRNSLDFDPRVGNINEPFVYFFEADNQDIFYHSIYFGFPFFLNYYKGEMKDPWSVMYTTDWKEIVDAHKTGQSLKRFMSTNIAPVKITNIYSYKLEKGNLLNTTVLTREKLLLLDKDPINK